MDCRNSILKWLVIVIGVCDKMGGCAGKISGENDRLWTIGYDCAHVCNDVV